MQESRNGHSASVAPTPASFHDVGQDLMGRVTTASPSFRLAAVVLGALFLAGVVGLFIRLQGGFANREAWGYYAAVWVFMFTTAQAAPIAAMATRIVKGHWRRSQVRISELFAVVGLFNLLLFIPFLALMPPREGRPTMWFDWPIIGGPVLWDFLAVLFLTLCGLGLLYLSALPDFALLRDHTTGARRALYSFLAHGWVGTKKQWKMTTALLNVLGPFYLMFFVFTSSMIAMDYSMSLVPGWRDAIYPAFHTISGLQNASAMTLVAMLLMRQFGGLQGYIGVDQFWGLSKPMLAFSLLWFYHWWATFITYWYGRTEAEQAVLTLLMFGPYFIPFAIAFLGNFVIPLLCLIWNPVRKSIFGPPAVGVSIITGTFFDRVRLYVGPFSVEDSELGHHVLEHVPATHLPDFADILIIVGWIAGAVLVYMLATKLIPAISVWETKEGLVLHRERPYLRSHVAVIAKPQ